MMSGWQVHLHHAVNSNSDQRRDVPGLLRGRLYRHLDVIRRRAAERSRRF